MLVEIKNTKPFFDQKFGTSGLRKKTKSFMQPKYVENFIQSISNVINIKDKSVVLGGDGRYFNKEAISTTVKILVANQVKKIYIGRGGLFSTPAISNFIIKNQLDYGFIFSASHNPAGEHGDFGIKLNASHGSGINQDISNKIYEETKRINQYKIIDEINIDINKIGATTIANSVVEVVDPVDDYVNLMQDIFNFPKIKNMIKDGLKIRYEGFSAVTGIYAKKIFGDILGVEDDFLYNVTPKEDFDGLHADPNRIYLKNFIDLSKSKESPDIMFASDGDGDRNIIIGKNILVSPSDSLAVILKYAHLISFYKDKLFGVARSFPTSAAVDSVAKSMGLTTYATPTGWKYFGDLLKNNKITFCGEESYGTGSIHSGEKDGIWAMLFWLNILAETKPSVEDVVNNLWKEFGRYYFMRLDYEEISEDIAVNIFKNVEKVNNKVYKEKPIMVNKFNYIDPIRNTPVNTDIFNIVMEDNTRITVRKSGTSTSNTTVRFYVEKLEKQDINQDSHKYLESIKDFIVSDLCGGVSPSIID